MFPFAPFSNDRFNCFINRRLNFELGQCTLILFLFIFSFVLINLVPSFDVEGAFRFHARKFLDRPVFSNKMAVPPNACQMASAQGEGGEGQKFCRQKGPDSDRANTNSLFKSEMRLPRTLDSEIYPISDLVGRARCAVRPPQRGVPTYIPTGCRAM